MMVADSQSSSQLGDISRFKNMDLITPTEREARLALRDFDSGLAVISEKLINLSNAKNVISTLGAEGVLIHTSNNDEGYLTDRIPALNVAPKDVAGAGDSFLTCCAMSLALGCNIWESSFLGSLAAACQVGRIGNVPLTLVNIETELDNCNIK
jgi:sugar/nucleoside kinase (ribokinase family)